MINKYLTTIMYYDMNGKYNYGTYLFYYIVVCNVHWYRYEITLMSTSTFTMMGNWTSWRSSGR
jgi:hypothetical protein